MPCRVARQVPIPREPARNGDVMPVWQQAFFRERPELSPGSLGARRTSF